MNKGIFLEAIRYIITHYCGIKNQRGISQTTDLSLQFIL